MGLKNSDYIPSHVAIIMDGNRRWARSQGLPDGEGHKAGAKALESLIEPASKMGIKTMTVYALSTENIQERAKREVRSLFSLLKFSFQNKFKKLAEKGVRINILGEIEGLPSSVRKVIDDLKKVYIKNEAIRINVALNYGGKRELIQAIQELIKEGVDVNKINDEMISRHLYTNGQKDPDLVIRTGGRIRMSNFLLWQTAYSELYFTKKYWPDFTPEDLKKAVVWYQKQQRNFGK